MTLPIDLRPARTSDFDFCARLYLAAMDTIVRDVTQDATRGKRNLRRIWDVRQVRIITCDGIDIGWIQTSSQGDEWHLDQIFIDAPFRRRGIGTEVIRDLIRQAQRAGRPVSLAVVKKNPARQLYERMGFRTIDGDDRKFFMQRVPDAAMQ